MRERARQGREQRERERRERQGRGCSDYEAERVIPCSIVVAAFADLASHDPANKKEILAALAMLHIITSK